MSTYLSKSLCLNYYCCLNGPFCVEFAHPVSPLFKKKEANNEWTVDSCHKCVCVETINSASILPQCV